MPKANRRRKIKNEFYRIIPIHFSKSMIYIHLKNPNLDTQMNCKNCETNLSQEASYCQECGAKVITSRLTIRSMWASIVDQFLGWDNKYLLTIVLLLRKPEQVLKSFLTGTRKRYMAPFALLAINTALSMLIFNQYSEKYLELTTMINEAEYEMLESKMDPNGDNAEFQQQKLNQAAMTTSIQETILKYFNIFTFLLIPFYALIALLVFGKPYNYGEHLVITAYIQGCLFVVSILTFILSILVNPAIYSFSILFAIVYYLYVYGRLYKLSFGKLIIKLLKFLGILVVILILFGVLGAVSQFLKM